MSITLKGLGGAVESVNGKTGVVVLSPEDLGADSAGAASAAITQHEAATDPHPQYLTETEADAKYALIGSGGTGGDPTGTAAALLADHEAATDPHPQYLTKSEGDALYSTKTHSHTSSQISDFSEAVEDMIGGSIVAGAGVSVAYNDGTGKTTISASGSGGGGYAVQTRNGSLANQVHAFGLPATQSSYGFDAYALKEEAGLTNQAVAVESFDSTSDVNYEQTGAVVWNGQARPYTGETTTLQQDGQLFSANVRVDGRSVTFTSVPPSAIPLMTGPTSPAGHIVRESSFYTSTDAGWKAFEGVIGDSPRAWYSSMTAPPHWIVREFPVAVKISEYKIAPRPNTTYFASQAPNEWEMQGSNNGTVWVTLDAQSGVSGWASGTYKSFSIAEPASYKHYRLYITKVGNDGAGTLVAIGEMQLIQSGSPVLLRSGTDYFKSVLGVLSAVSAPTSAADFDANGFTSSGEIFAAQLEGKQPISLVAPSAVSVTSVYKPYSQIAIPNSLLGAGAFSQINSATVTATQTGNGKVRLAVSRDLVDWHVWDGSAWISVGTLAADTTSAEALLAGGMAPATVGGITVAQWAQFFAAAEGGLPDKIAFAYALDVPDPATDAASIDNVALNVNYTSAWLKQTPAQVEIRWYKDQVTFKTISAGNYKLAYQTP